jgi:hypothetical protein
MAKKIGQQQDFRRYRLNCVSLREIKDKYPDKLIDGYSEDGRLVIVLDTCRLKFDERVPQNHRRAHGNVYGATHKGTLN